MRARSRLSEAEEAPHTEHSGTKRLAPLVHAASIRRMPPALGLLQPFVPSLTTRRRKQADFCRKSLGC